MDAGIFGQRQTVHGGAHSVGKRKSRRPVAVKRPMHITMRAEVARGRLSLLHPSNTKKVFDLVHAAAKQCDVRIYEFANSGNHLHMLVRARHRHGFQTFLRVVSGKIAQAVTGAVKGKPFGKRFWDLLAFSRIVEWGKAFLTAKKYVQINRLEVLGLAVRLPQKNKKNRISPQRNPSPTLRR